MAGLTVFNPIHIPPFTSLEPIPSGPCSPSTSLTSATSDKLEPACTTLYDAQRRLMDILSLTDEPSSATYRTPPPPYAMHSPLTSTHKTPFSSYRRRHGRSPKSTMSFKFAAPVPRVPLASILQRWAAQGSPSHHAAAACGEDTSCKMDVDIDGREHEYDSPRSGLGLILGSGQASYTRAQARPHTHTQTELHAQSQSHSRSKYSRRLRRLAPAPLHLASTPKQVLHTLAQGPSPVTPTKRTPHSGIFEDIPLTARSGSFAFDPDEIPSLDLSASVSAISPAERRPSIASVLASMSTALTSLALPARSENENESENPSTRPRTDTNTTVEPTSDPSPSYVDLLVWRRAVSGALDSSLSPLHAHKSAKCSVHAVSAMLCSPVGSPLRSSAGHVTDICIYSPGLPHDPVPPPLRRTEWVALPDVADDGPHSPTDSDVSRLPLCADLRLDLNAEDLTRRAEMCAETITRASLSLRSCSLLKDPEAIGELCESLRQTFKAVQRALDGTPTEFVIDDSDAKQNWYTKHWDTIDSLNKNVSLFYLLARQIEDHPPRIHKLAPLLDKLTTYQAKFADLARRITVSHEKLRLLNLRNQLATATTTARAHEDLARLRRREERTLFQEGRVRRRELREEMRHVRGTIRAIRGRQADATAHDENMMVCDTGNNTDRPPAWKSR
ncbi:hypothetical protein C8Q80DRAFT_1148142 [Daedaleopsis nitida]|nr:hypothetical protein C8Q80DRAFT_1148142 [Daedaleopsis nitida]